MKIKMSEEELLLLEEFIEVNKLKIEIVSVIKDEPLYKLTFSKLFYLGYEFCPQ